MNTNENAQSEDNLGAIADDEAFLNGLRGTVEGIEKIKDGEMVEGDVPEEEEEVEEEVEVEEIEEEEEGEIQEEATEAEVAPQENGTKKPDKMWKVKRSKFKALAEKRAALEGERVALEENVKLKEMLEESLNSGSYHYGKTTYAELEKAKDSKKKAIEEGNIDALIEADLKLNAAQNNVHDLEKWAASNKMQEQAQAPANNGYANANNNNQNAHNQVEQEMAADWLDNHSYLKPGTREYNPELAQEVSDFINHLDGELVNRGQRDVLFSEKYFETIDDYIGEVNNKIKGGGKKSSSKNLESAAHIGGVRNSYSSSPTRPSPTRVTLTADEKLMCQNSGVSEKEWLKYKLQDLKKGK